MIGRLLAAALLALVPGMAAAQKLDTRPRTAVMTAFPPEWEALVGTVEGAVTHRINGLTVLTGTIAGRPVVLVQSGISMVNAAMNTQLILDRFTVKRIVFSGIAGGLDPAFDIGDVVVPERWGQYLEVAMARVAGQGYAPTPLPGSTDLPNLGMMFPRDVIVGSAAEPVAARRWIAADAGLLALARRTVGDTALRRCPPAPATTACLDRTPRVMVGGTGISGSAFVDNAEYRRYLHATFGATLADMESAAVAQVAWSNGVPFIVFRSLSDLAGGDAGANRMTSFMALAADNSASVVRRFVAVLPD